MHPALTKTIMASALSIYIAGFRPSFAAEQQSGVRHTTDGPEIVLSEETLEAIDSGISLTFNCEFAFITRWLLFDWKNVKFSHEFTISKHSLSDRYLVHRDDQATPIIFRSSSQGVQYIAKSTQNLFRQYVIQDPKLELRVSLSKYDLPAPMRLSAFTSKSWNFDSGWKAWQSEAF